MFTCTRPHCAIRSHKHFTFADFLELDEHYRIIARSVKDDNIENYKILSDKLSKYNGHTCVRILNNMLICVEHEKNLEMRKLKALYVFSMCRTLHFIKLIRTETPIVRDSIHDAYNRLLKQAENDKLFVSEMEKLRPI
jgi:hypothetical protein